MNEDIKEGIDPEDKPEKVPENNDEAGYDDDTIGENTEITPLAAEIKKDEDAKVAAMKNQGDKDFSEKNG